MLCRPQMRLSNGLRARSTLARASSSSATRWSFTKRLLHEGTAPPPAYLAQDNTVQLYNRPELVRISQLLCASFAKVMQKPLAGIELHNCHSPELVARRLAAAPVVVVMHGVQDDPIFCYGNLTALKAFEMSWDQLTSLPSRYSAEPGPREQRAVMMARLAGNPQGFVTDYQGIRISAKGNRFRIEDGVIWNVTDEEGRRVGQAATFSSWTALPAAGGPSSHS